MRIPNPSFGTALPFFAENYRRYASFLIIPNWE